MAQPAQPPPLGAAGNNPQILPVYPANPQGPQPYGNIPPYNIQQVPILQGLVAAGHAQNLQQAAQVQAQRAQVQANDRQQRVEDIQEILTALARSGVGSNTINAYSLAKQHGFMLTPQGEFMMEGQMNRMPLPFEDRFSLALQDHAVTSAYGGEGGRAADDQLHAQLAALGPELYQANYTRDSLYQGVPQDPVLNRMRIILQRKRENSMYAFQ